MTYLVGYSPYKDDVGAIELACQFARSEHDTVDALTVVPAGWSSPIPGGSDREFQQWAKAEGEASAAQAGQLLAQHPDVTSSATWVTGRSVPQAICDIATARDASIICVGSGENGPRGHVTLTSKTDRLLHSSDVPIAIAPRGYRPPAGSRITRITVSFRDDDATWQLLTKVAEIAKRVNACLRLVTFTIRARSMVTSAVRGAEDLVFDEWRAQAKQAQDEALAHLLSEGHSADAVTAVLAEGRSWGGAMDSVDWGDGDVLVVGSSSTHKLAQVFLGSSASKILRNSAVPVVVVP